MNRDDSDRLAGRRQIPQLSETAQHLSFAPSSSSPNRSNPHEREAAIARIGLMVSAVLLPAIGSRGAYQPFLRFFSVRSWITHYPEVELSQADFSVLMFCRSSSA